MYTAYNVPLPRYMAHLQKFSQWTPQKELLKPCALHVHLARFGPAERVLQDQGQGLPRGRAQVKFATNVHQKDLTAMSNSEFPTKYHPFLSFLTEGSSEVKLPTIWTDEKQRWEESEKRREENRREGEEKEKRRRRSKKRKFQKKEDPGARKGRKKSRNTVFFEWFVAHEGRKVGWLKQRVRSHLARWDEKLHAVVARMTKKCAPLWREAHFEVKTYKTHHSQTLLQVEMLNKCMPLWHEAHFEVNMYKTHHVQTNFGS